MSALLLSVGADSNLLLSPVNVKAWPPASDELVALVLELELAGFNSDHGTATSLPELEDVLLDGLVEDEVEDDELVLDDDPELLNEITANSTRPELGLMMVSLIVPRFSPEELWTEQLLI